MAATSTARHTRYVDSTDARSPSAPTIERAAAAAACAVFAHARDIDSGAEVGVRADEPVVTASVFKVPVLTEYVLQVAAGELDPAARIRVPAGSVTQGSTGISVFRDDADLSLRDLATSMITVSDNGATDIVTALVGVDRVNATMRRLGLEGTVLTGDCASLFAAMAEEMAPEMLASGEPLDKVLAAASADRIGALTVCTPGSTNRSTPAECTRLLQLLWTDGAAAPEACAEARRILGLQIWPHRLSSGFPRDDVTISGKTGTIGIVRNEIGVVEYPDGGRYAVAVFLRCERTAFRQPAADTLIGTVAAALVGALRSPAGR